MQFWEKFHVSVKQIAFVFKSEFLIVTNISICWFYAASVYYRMCTYFEH